MSIFKAFNNEAFTLCKKMHEPIYKVPTSIQESIPVSRISEDGVFEIEAKEDERLYDKLYMFNDINFCDLDESEKREKFRTYCDILNSLETNFKIQIYNFNEEMEKFREDVLLKYDRTLDEEDVKVKYAKAYNEIINENMIKGVNGITQVKFINISVEKDSFESARAYFNAIEPVLKQKFKELGSELIPVQTEERLKFLFYIYQMGKESEFDLRPEALKIPHVWKDDVAGDFMFVKKSFIQTAEDKYVGCMFLNTYASTVSDTFISELTNAQYKLGLTIDITPISKEVAYKKAEEVYQSVEHSIEEQQKVRNKMGAYSSDISYKKRQEKREIEKYLDDMNKNDANMFWVQILLFVVGDTKEELDNNINNIISISKNFKFRKCIKKQLQAFNSSLPLGGRYVDYMQPLFTQPLAGLIPFYTKKIRHKGGFYYGINQNDKSIITVNRKTLDNGNGFIFGVPGAGKSFFAKMEMGQVYATTNDDMLIIDPQGEYRDIGKNWNGNYINFGSQSEAYINPFDIPKEALKDFNAFVSDKSSFIVSLIHTLMGDDMNSYHKSCIEQAVRNIYAKAKETRVVPKFTNLSEELGILEGEMSSYGKEVAVAIDPFVNGSLNIFNKRTNIDVNSNRLTIFGLSQIQPTLWKSAMLIMVEFINDRVYDNGRNNKSTWVWCDEFHVLTENEQEAVAMEKCYKTYRKFGGLITGMTQNINDMIQNKTTRTIVANCEYIALLKQANLDRNLIKDIVEITDSQTRYITNSSSGTGLLRVGKDVIAFDDTISSSNNLYKLFNTDPHRRVTYEAV